MTTFANLIQKAIIELREEPGVSVQAYAEDVIAAKMQRIFNALFDQYFWPRYTTNGATFTLDGTTGQVTAALTTLIKRFDDVQYIWYGSEQKPLSRKPTWINPNTVTGGLRRYWEPISTNKIFRILPITTTGTIAVSYRTQPAAFTGGEEVLMDDDLLIAGTLFDYLVDDGENEMAIKKWKSIFDARESQLRQALNMGPIPFGSAAPSPFTEWMTNP